jgi:hypothetical protein
VITTATTRPGDDPALAQTPFAPPCGPFRNGEQGSARKPSYLAVGCLPTGDYVDSLTWLSWTTTDATATGMHHVSDCGPECDSGGFSTSPVRVTLTDPQPEGSGSSFVFFSRLAIAPTTSARSAEIVSEDEPPHWGWA